MRDNGWVRSLAQISKRYAIWMALVWRIQMTIGLESALNHVIERDEEEEEKKN